jgi:hypothetical protein
VCVYRAWKGCRSASGKYVFALGLHFSVSNIRDIRNSRGDRESTKLAPTDSGMSEMGSCVREWAGPFPNRFRIPESGGIPTLLDSSSQAGELSTFHNPQGAYRQRAAAPPLGYGSFAAMPWQPDVPGSRHSLSTHMARSGVPNPQTRLISAIQLANPSPPAKDLKIDPPECDDAP